MQLDFFKVRETEPHCAHCPTCGLRVKTFLHAEWFPAHYGLNRASTWWSQDADWRPGDPINIGQDDHWEDSE